MFGAGSSGRDRKIFGDVPRKACHLCGAFGIGRIGAQHEAVVLHRGAAARGGDHDGIEVFDRRPGIDVGPRLDRAPPAPGPCDGRTSRSSRRLRRTTTSMPSRVSRRIAAALICGASTSLTQPASKATRPFLPAPRPGRSAEQAGGAARATAPDAAWRQAAAGRPPPRAPRRVCREAPRPAPAGSAVDKATAAQARSAASAPAPGRR